MNAVDTLKHEHDPIKRVLKLLRNRFDNIRAAGRRHLAVGRSARDRAACPLGDCRSWDGAGR
jgi:hypothetical protein